jgi:hypothetical protein
MSHMHRVILTLGFATMVTSLSLMSGCPSSTGTADALSGESLGDAAGPPVDPPGVGEATDSSDPSAAPTEPVPEPSGGDPVSGEVPQSGTLTAGSFDDNLNLEAFRQFLGQIGQAAPESPLSLNIGTRALIRVQNEADEPVGGASVAVRTVSIDQTPPITLLAQPSGTDGFVTFFTAIDGAADSQTFEVTVTPPGGGAPVTLTKTLSDPNWTVTLPGQASIAPSQLDLLFVVDTTGSMNDELDFLKSEVRSIATAVAELHPSVAQRYGLILYRDDGDLYVTRKFDFTSSLDEFRTNLAAQNADGGGDWPEAMHLALSEAASLGWSDGLAARVLFLIADAPPHEQHVPAALAATKLLRAAGVAMYPVAASGVDTKAEVLFRVAALLTHSEYVFLTDDSGVGNSHEAPHIPCYHVQRLDQLMIRLIGAELAGHRIEADPTQIIRTVGNPVNGVCTTGG